MKKNILFILCDQLRPDFLGCYGADFVKTPHIDKIREEGVLFSRALSHAPLCVPARAALLTGRNALVNGVLDNGKWLRPDRKECGIETWPEILGKEGYHTAAIGKMHFYPWDIKEGFHDRIISEDKRHTAVKDDYYDYLAQHGWEKYHASRLEGYYENRGAVINPLPSEHHVDTWVASRTCEYIENYDSSEPLALMVGFPGPHCPYDPAQEDFDAVDEGKMPDSIPATAESELFRDFFIGNNILPWNGVDYTDFTAEHKKKLRVHYCALINQIDRGVGRIIESLKAKGIYDETMIIFTADHGDMMGDMDLMAKHFFFETSIGVPLIIKDGKSLKGRQVDDPVCLTDLFATLLTTAGVSSEADSRDSFSLLKTDGSLENIGNREAVFGATDIGFMLTDREWKLCRHSNGAQMLYNMEEDPTEQVNRINDPACRVVLNSMDRILTERIMDSVNLSHAEKIVQSSGAVGEGNFGERGWSRPYPRSL